MAKKVMKSQRASRAKPRAKGAALRGRGSYLGDLWNAGKRYIPRAVGGAIGSLVGKKQAGWDMGGDFSQKVLGWGDYTAPWSVGMNSLVTKGQAPSITNVSESGMRLSHREYIGTVYSSTTFSNSVFYVNPGLVSTFPWLSRIAANFQQYELMGAVLTFKSALTDAVASFSSLGSVIIAADLNAAAAPATSQLQMEQMQFVASAKPSESIVAPVECAPKLGGGGVRYIRLGSVPVAASILDYDHCSIQVAATGQPSNGVELGRLYLSYDIKLLNPKMIYGAASTASYSFVPVSGYCYGVVGPSRIYDTVGLSFPTDGTGFKTVTIPAGSGTEVILDLYIQAGADMTGGVVSTVLTNTVASTRVFPSGNAFLTTPPNGVVTRAWAGTWAFRIIDPSVNASITFTGIPFASTSVVSFIELTMVPALNTLASAPPGQNFTYSSSPPSLVPDEKELLFDRVDEYVPISGAAAAAGVRNTPGRRL